MGKRIWSYNEDFFETIDSNEKSYWMGFIMADGYIIDNRNKDNKSCATGLRIRLSEIDKSHLEKLNIDISSNKPIKTVKNYGIYENSKDLSEFYLSSNKIVDDLYKLGLPNGNKSCNEFLPKLDKSHYTKNFILGLFDGDGCISIYKSWSSRDKKYKTSTEWQIVSSLEILNDIKDFLLSELPELKFQKISKNNNKKDNNLYRLRIGNKNSIKKLYEYFYLNNCSSSYLDRKYNNMKYIYDNL